MSDSVDIVAACGGELVTYIPFGGVAKQFKAIVERQPSQVQQSGGGAYPVNTVAIMIPNDATNGVTAIQPRKDRVRFKKNLSDAQEMEFTVQKILHEDAGLIAGDGGMFRVEVKA